jgi:hypothetical protein
MATLASRILVLEQASSFASRPNLVFCRYSEFDADAVAVAELGGIITPRLRGESLEALTARAPSATVRHLIYSD